MKHIILLFLINILIFQAGFSQFRKLYDAEIDPVQQFENAVNEAKETNKHVMVQIGGNWCPWCLRFHDFYENDPELDSIVKYNYVIIHVNYDPKKNHELFNRLAFPQRFGFPVIVICDSTGMRLHTQNSWYLEDGKNSYDKEKFKSFLKSWTVQAVDPENY